MNTTLLERLPVELVARVFAHAGALPPRLGGSAQEVRRAMLSNPELLAIWLLARDGFDAASVRLMAAGKREALRHLVRRVPEAERALRLNGALVRAAELGRADAALLLCAEGADPNAFQAEALMRAAQRGHDVVVWELCQLGARATARDSEALVRAARFGHAAAFARLCELGADVHARDEEALLVAARGGHVELLIDMLCRRKVRAADRALVAAADAGQQLAVEYLALVAGADPGALDGEALLCAAGAGHANVVRFLLGRGVDPGVREGSALVHAVVGGHRVVMRLLLLAGADVRASDDEALAAAAAIGDGGVVQDLLDAGAYACGRNHDIITAALQCGHADALVRIVLASRHLGSDPQGVKDQLLAKAVKERRTELARGLFALGADPKRARAVLATL